MNFSRTTHLIASHICWAWILCLVAGLLQAQEIPTEISSSTAQQEPWQPPEITDLSINWWQGFDTASPEEFEQKIRQFAADTRQKFQGLAGEDFFEAGNLLSKIQGQADLLALALGDTEQGTFEPVLTREAYTLDELLKLRHQWREIEEQKVVPTLRIEELQNKSSLLEQRRDDLLRQYASIPVNAPARIILGLQRVSARLEYELTNLNMAFQQDRIAKLEQQGRLLEDQQNYARARLIGEETDWQSIENEAALARKDADSQSERLARLQNLLLEVLSAKNPKPSLELLRKQQLTQAAASEKLALLREALNRGRANWYRLQSGMLDPGFDLNRAIQKTEELVRGSEKQLEVWTAASQTTLVTPLPDSELNARKNVELAHSVAQETLEILGDIRDRSDDLVLVQDILTSSLVETQSGLRSLWTRLTLVSDNVAEGLSGILNFHLFRIGEAPITLGGIIMMLMIIVFGVFLSWFIRHLLDRLKGRRQYAKTSAVYTLGRILHYIIIITAVFVALGTIGLDFTNLALIAGALSVGIGFGLQSIVNNFVSGLILLFEGSLRVGDYIELDSGLRGTVKEINTRATVINTNDSIDVVVPNSEFVTARLTNWTLRDPMARLRINFGVAYGSDKEAVKEAALEAASEVEFILQHTPGREAQVWLTDFGDSSLNFELLAWVSKSGVRRPQRTRSQFLWALETKLTERGIEIPFPQRDLHLRSGFTQTVTENTD